MPPMHPNCKCTITPHTGIELFKDREGANPLQDNPKFEEWKKRYVKEGGLSASVGDPKNGIEKHEEKKLLECIDAKNANLIQSKLNRYTKEIAGDNEKENAVCITKSGNIFHCKGVLGEVYPDFDLKEELSEAYVTHNHPISETHFSFSDKDISLFMDYKLPELIGIDDEYIYRILRTSETKYADSDSIVHSYKGDIYAEYMQAAFMGEVNPDTDEYDFIVRRIAETYGFKYEREKR
jgi:hypothetical protein